MPWPLYLDLNPCAYACAYCWSNLDGKKQELDLQVLKKQLDFIGSDWEIGEGIAAFLLEKKYPVCFSPTSDPFAPSNEEAFLRVLELLEEVNLPRTYETRGGRLAAQTLLAEPLTAISIALTTDRPDIAQKYEPKAPCLEERLELAQALKRQGHFVEIGLNPLVPAWWRDINGLLERLSKMGLTHLLIQDLNLNLRQRQAFPFQDDEFLTYAMKQSKPDWQEIWAVKERAWKLGFYVDPLYGSNYAQWPDHYFGEYFRMVDTWVPTMQEFFFLLARQQKELGKPIYYSAADFTAWADLGFDFNSPSFGNYLGGWSRELGRSGKGIWAQTFSEVHRQLFAIYNSKTPFWAEETSLLCQASAPLFDDQGAPILCFDCLAPRRDFTELDEATPFRGRENPMEE